MSEAKNNLSNIIDHIKEVVFVIDKESEMIIEVNNAAQNLLLYSKDSFTGSYLKDYTRKSTEKEIEKILNHPELYDERCLFFELKTKQDIFLPFEISISQFEENSINLIIAVCRNISERKKSTDKENEYKRLLISLSLSAIDFLKLTPEDDVFEYIADKLHEQLPDQKIIVSEIDEQGEHIFIKHVKGCSIEEMLSCNEKTGKELLKTKYPLEKGTIDEIREGKLNYFSGSTIKRFRSFLKQDDLLIMMDLNKIKGIHSIGISSGEKMFGRVTFFSDSPHAIERKDFIENFIYQASFTLQRIEAERNLIDAKDKAEESDRLKTAFLANISHEIRTPMNAILGFSQLLKHPNLNEDRRENYLNIIADKGNDLLNILNDLIDISLIESKQLKIENKKFSVNKLMDDLFSYYSSRVKPGISFSIEKVKSEGDDLIIADMGRIKQVLSNLINNSIKFTLEGYVICGYKIRDNEQVEFFVKDSGIGIPLHKQEIIFRRFMQASSDFIRAYGGNGLGLTISKELVELMNGKIWVDSKVGKGSVFTFSVPLSNNQMGTKTEQNKDENKAFTLKGKSILIAEDDDTNFEYLNEILEAKNASVLWARDGLEAIQQFKGNKGIDLVLMDLKMPRLGGLDATSQIRQLDAEVPIIAQTAYAMEGDKEKCLDAGCTDYLTKPIKRVDLLNAVARYLL